LSIFWVTEFLAEGAHLSAADTLSPDLACLQGQLSGVLAQARASSTNLVYMKAFSKWKAWTLAHSKVEFLPAVPQFVSLYLIHIANTALSFSVIKAAACGIAWAHKLAGFASPTENALVIETLAGLKVRLAKPKQPKDPFAVEHIHKIFDNMVATDLTDVRNVALMGLAFYAFLRFDDVSRLKVNNITIHNTHAEIRIEKAKKMTNSGRAMWWW
jgi:integrase